jgi:hypothetical protein
MAGRTAQTVFSGEGGNGMRAADKAGGEKNQQQTAYRYLTNSAHAVLPNDTNMVRRHQLKNENVT